MIGPFVLDNLVVKLSIVVGSWADVEDKILAIVVLIEIVGNIFDRIPVGLFKEVGGWIGHCDNSVGDVGEIEFLSVIGCLFFRAGYYISDEWLHVLIKCCDLNGL